MRDFQVDFKPGVKRYLIYRSGIVPMSFIILLLRGDETYYVRVTKLYVIP